MLRDGPIPRGLHGLLEYVVGALFVAFPFILGYDNNFAVGVSIVVGVLVLILAAATVGTSSLIDSIPLTVHAAIDYALAAFLIASPFIFGFSGEGAPTAVFIIVGVVHLLLTIGTRFKEPSPPPLAT
ncbi:MAG: SPW repeat domain-containing protein [Geodermatophilaceae bacterium]